MVSYFPLLLEKKVKNFGYHKLQKRKKEDDKERAIWTTRGTNRRTHHVGIIERHWKWEKLDFTWF